MTDPKVNTYTSQYLTNPALYGTGYGVGAGLYNNVGLSSPLAWNVPNLALA